MALTSILSQATERPTESELKEKALKKKVIEMRKSSMSGTKPKMDID